MDDGNSIPIFFASNDKYAPYLSVAIASILYNTKEYIQFYILDSGISVINKKMIELLHNKFKNFSIEYIKINLREKFENFSEINNGYSITTDMYSRLLIADLKPNIDKAIYLDVDICVIKDIKELYNINLENNSLAVIKSYYINKITNREKQIFYSSINDYFNSGVLLINCKKWRESNSFEKMMKMFREKSKFYSLYDQDLLNDYFRDDVKYFLASIV